MRPLNGLPLSAGGGGGGEPVLKGGLRPHRQGRTLLMRALEDTWPLLISRAK